MSARASWRGASVFDATCGAPEHSPALIVQLPGDMRATLRAHADLHRLLRDIPPQRRAVASLLMGALIDSATPKSGARGCVQLRMWRLPGRVHLEMHTTAPAFVRDRSRMVMDSLARHWECDTAACCVRVEMRTTLSAPPCGR